MRGRLEGPVEEPAAAALQPCLAPRRHEDEHAGRTLLGGDRARVDEEGLALLGQLQRLGELLLHVLEVDGDLGRHPALRPVPLHVPGERGGGVGVQAAPRPQDARSQVHEGLAGFHAGSGHRLLANPGLRRQHDLLGKDVSILVETVVIKLQLLDIQFIRKFHLCTLDRSTSWVWSLVLPRPTKSSCSWSTPSMATILVAAVTPHSCTHAQAWEGGLGHCWQDHPHPSVSLATREGPLVLVLVQVALGVLQVVAVRPRGWNKLKFTSLAENFREKS